MNDIERICETGLCEIKRMICIFKIKIKPYDIKEKGQIRKSTEPF